MSQKNNGIVIYSNGESRTENQDNFPIVDDITTDKKTNKLGNITIIITIAIVVGYFLPQSTLQEKIKKHHLQK